MQHRIKTYQDGFKAIEFCEICSVEGMDLYTTSCQPIGLKCTKCGYRRFTNIPCGNCEKISEMFRKAVDKHNSRN